VIICLLVICGIYVHSLYILLQNHLESTVSKDADFYANLRYATVESDDNFFILYDVYVNRTLEATFELYKDAYDYAKDNSNASIYEHHTLSWVWDNYPPFELNVNNMRIMHSSFISAKEEALKYDDAWITFKHSGAKIWERDYTPASSYFIDVPMIEQLPELPRGCEVTSLAMLLNYMGIEVDKMTLADEVSRHENNPYKGFLGNMYNWNEWGYGVYHEPIFELMHKYLPDRAIDMTYTDFEDLYYLIEQGSPIWVLINTTYNRLPASRYQNLRTDEGIMQITYSMHSVLVTGYDENYIYFNDPLSRATRAPKSGFIAAWKQMGRQAVAAAPVY